MIQFSRDSSPEDVDRLVIESEAPTEPDTEEYIVVGGRESPRAPMTPGMLVLSSVTRS